jgi:hypothetical protein
VVNGDDIQDLLSFRTGGTREREREREREKGRKRERLGGLKD